MLARTGADALMIGRAAQGRPWIFGEIAHHLATGGQLAPPATADVGGWLVAHLHEHYALYGEFTGVRSARKHIGWALRSLPGGAALRERMNLQEDAQAQVQGVASYFAELAERHPLLPAASAANDDALRQQA